jgi:hypothetical protein
MKAGELGDELLALKGEISRLLNAPTDDILETARNGTEALALGELGDTLSEEEEHVERMIAERPIAAMAAAFAFGVAIGYMLRRN